MVSQANFPFTWSVDYGGDNYMVDAPQGMVCDTASATNQDTTTGVYYTNCHAAQDAYNCALDMSKGVTEPFLSADTVSNLPGGTENDAIENNLRSGHLVQYSLEIQKQFGAESYNISNSTNLGLPSTTLGTGTYGQITSANGNPRLFQFALRLSF